MFGPVTFEFDLLHDDSKWAVAREREVFTSEGFPTDHPKATVMGPLRK